MKHLTRFGAVTGVLMLGGALLAACGGGPTDQLVMVGSDTTQDVMAAFASQYNSAKGATDKAHAVNVPAVIDGSHPAPGSIAKDTDLGGCDSFTINTTAGHTPPNGSSAGISALINDGSGSPTPPAPANEKGCYDIARSSRARKSSDTSDLDFYAFAKDAVSWSSHGNAHGVINLTQAQLQNIYLCTQGTGTNKTPLWTDWSQVPNSTSSGPIHRYLPQNGSGTLSFFESRILGITGTDPLPQDDTDCATPPTRVEENHGTAVSDTANAIFPYSFAVWTAQANQAGGIPDSRAGFVLHKINNVAPGAATVNNNTFLGRRYVYNVVKNNSLGNASPALSKILKVVGVQTAANGGNGYLCSDNSTVNNIITTYGFIQIPLGPAGSGLPNSRCRKNPTPL